MELNSPEEIRKVISKRLKKYLKKREITKQTKIDVKQKKLYTIKVTKNNNHILKQYFYYPDGTLEKIIKANKEIYFHDGNIVKIIYKKNLYLIEYSFELPYVDDVKKLLKSIIIKKDDEIISSKIYKNGNLVSSYKKVRNLEKELENEKNYIFETTKNLEENIEKIKKSRFSRENMEIYDLHGEVVEYYDNLRPKLIKNYNYGVLHGFKEFFYEDGFNKKLEFYKNGKLLDTIIEFNENHELIK